MIGKQNCLYSDSKNFTLIWNAKSASALAVNWFFFQIGMDSQITNSGIFPHKFRSGYEHNLKKSKRLADLEKILNSNLICVVRHPYSRVISMYKHFIVHDWINDRVSKFVSQPINKSSKISFCEFLNFLSSINLDTFDIHFIPQARNFLNDKINYEIVKSENFIDRIKQVENKFDLKSSPIESFSKNLEYHNKNIEEKITTPCYDVRFNTVDYNGFPKDELFLNNEIKLIIQNLYPDDFTQFKYEY